MIFCKDMSNGCQCDSFNGDLCRRGSDTEAASSGFTPPDAPFADAPEEPSRMIEREEISEVLPVLVQQPSFIDYAGVDFSHSSVAPHALSNPREYVLSMGRR